MSDGNGTSRTKVLLVLPEWKATSNRWKLTGHPYIRKKAFMPPLSLATLAALTPDGFDTEIWDESIHGPIEDDTEFPDHYDIVGVGGYITSIFRAHAVARVFRRRGTTLLVAGGAGVTSAPEQYRDAFDVLILGEAERTWPQFLADYGTGQYKDEYHDDNSVSMELSPKPIWGRIAPVMRDEYAVSGVQT